MVGEGLGWGLEKNRRGASKARWGALDTHSPLLLWIWLVCFGHLAYEIFVLWTKIKPMSPAVEVRSLITAGLPGKSHESSLLCVQASCFLLDWFLCSSTSVSEFSSFALNASVMAQTRYVLWLRPWGFLMASLQALLCPITLKVKWKLLSCIWLFAIPWVIQSMAFSRSEYWSG